MCLTYVGARDLPIEIIIKILLYMKKMSNLQLQFCCLTRVVSRKNVTLQKEILS